MEIIIQSSKNHFGTPYTPTKSLDIEIVTIQKLTSQQFI